MFSDTTTRDVPITAKLLSADTPSERLTASTTENLIAAKGDAAIEEKPNIGYTALAAKVYETFKVSPETTGRSPTVKLPTENKVPAVPLFALSVVRNAPATVVEELTVNTSADDVLITDGSAVVAVPKETAGRVVCEYAIFSAQPECNTIVSSAEYTLLAPGPVTRPINQDAV